MSVVFYTAYSLTVNFIDGADGVDGVYEAGYKAYRLGFGGKYVDVWYLNTNTGVKKTFYPDFTDDTPTGSICATTTPAGTNEITCTNSIGSVSNCCKTYRYI